MNIYMIMWRDRGYGRRWARIHACKASEARKQVACVRVWNRMLKA